MTTWKDTLEATERQRRVETSQLEFGRHIEADFLGLNFFLSITADLGFSHCVHDETLQTYGEVLPSNLLSGVVFAS